MGQEYGRGICTIRHWNGQVSAQKVDGKNCFAWSHDGHRTAKVSGFRNLRDPFLATFPRLCKDGIEKKAPPYTIHSFGFF